MWFKKQIQIFDLCIMTEILYVKYPLSVSHEVTYPEVLRQWAWFRKYLMKFYGLKTLPETFSEDEGEISENERLYEEDGIEYDLRAVEYNYTWHSQTLKFDEGEHHVEVIVNVDEFGDWYMFKYTAGTDESDIKFFVSSRERYLELHKNSSLKVKWRLACEEIVEKK